MSAYIQLEQGIKIPIREGVLGRDGQGQEVLAQYSDISRVHARFFKIADQWYIEDYSSIHGTIHNGQKLSPFIKSQLADGRIRFGQKVNAIFYLSPS